MKILIACLAVIALSGCTDASRSQLGSYGSKFKVTLYSGGEPVRTWTSTGKVLTEQESDGWYFTDADTGKLVRLSGDVVVEQQ